MHKTRQSEGEANPLIQILSVLRQQYLLTLISRVNKLYLAFFYISFRSPPPKKKIGEEEEIIKKYFGSDFFNFF